MREYKDHRVPYRSKLDANYNQDVHLFVREYDGTLPDQSRKCVLMIHGRSIPAITTFDLVYDNNVNYSWAQYLASNGFDVFLLDLQGSGLSPLAQLEDPCNASTSDQGGILNPNPITPGNGCDASYPYPLYTSQSEWAELDTVVNFILEKHTDVEKVAFISNSAGAWAVGPYVLQHPQKVESVLFSAPVFPPNGPTYPPTKPESDSFPLSLQRKAAFKQSWRIELDPLCQQVEPEIMDKVWDSLMKIDRIGSGWGKSEDGGLLRYKNARRWGWNRYTVKQKTTAGDILGGSVPVFIIYGQQDRSVINAPAQFDVEALYDEIPGEKRMIFKLACAGHQMMWEKVAPVLHEYHNSTVAL